MLLVSFVRRIFLEKYSAWQITSAQQTEVDSKGEKKTKENQHIRPA